MSGVGQRASGRGSSDPIRTLSHLRSCSRHGRYAAAIGARNSGHGPLTASCWQAGQDQRGQAPPSPSPRCQGVWRFRPGSSALLRQGLQIGFGSAGMVTPCAVSPTPRELYFPALQAVDCSGTTEPQRCFSHIRTTISTAATSTPNSAASEDFASSIDCFHLRRPESEGGGGVPS